MRTLLSRTRLVNAQSLVKGSTHLYLFPDHQMEEEEEEEEEEDDDEEEKEEEEEEEEEDDEEEKEEEEEEEEEDDDEEEEGEKESKQERKEKNGRRSVTSIGNYFAISHTKRRQNNEFRRLFVWPGWLFSPSSLLLLLAPTQHLLSFFIV